jgi:uncharacterized membrane protein YdcZ (DUF606 family)
MGLQAPIAGAMGQRVGRIEDNVGLPGVITRRLDVTRAVGIAVLALGTYLIEK